MPKIELAISNPWPGIRVRNSNLETVNEIASWIRIIWATLVLIPSCDAQNSENELMIDGVYWVKGVRPSLARFTSVLTA